MDMRTIVFDRYGAADVLRPGRSPVPAPAPGQVVVRVAAAGVNPADAALRAGRFRLVARLRLPFVPGADVAGVVESVGDDVEGLERGRPVMAMLPVTAGGGYAEFAAVDAASLAAVPPHLDLRTAATVPLAALTALQALRDHGRVRPGSRVLVHGAGGGVGTFAVQVAAALGASVTAVAGQANHELLHALGVQRVVDRSAGLPQDGAHDVVLDAVGTLPMRHMRPALRRDGVAVTLNPGRGNRAAVAARRLLPGPRLASLLVRPSGPDLQRIAGWIEDGSVRPVVERTWPLDEATAAHRHSESGRSRGKLGLVVDPALATATPASLAARPSVQPATGLQP